MLTDEEKHVIDMLGFTVEASGEGGCILHSDEMGEVFLTRYGGGWYWDCFRYVNRPDKSVTSDGLPLAEVLAQAWNHHLLSYGQIPKRALGGPDGYQYTST